MPPNGTGRGLNGIVDVLLVDVDVEVEVELLLVDDEVEVDVLLLDVEEEVLVDDDEDDVDEDVDVEALDVVEDDVVAPHGPPTILLH